MQSMLMPFPCPVVTVTDAHGTDAHAVDADTMSGILNTHATDTMNQIPMEPIPNFVDGNFICKWYQLSAVEQPVYHAQKRKKRHFSLFFCSKMVKKGRFGDFLP